MQNFGDFKEFVERNSTVRSALTKKWSIREDAKHLLFIISCPDKLEWDFGVEKQAQTSWLLLSGGVTGAGHGHDYKLCYQSEVNDILKECDHTHAMIVSVGWVCDMTLQVDGDAFTPIVSFYEFAKSDVYCRAHIIAKKDRPVYFHNQHIELNVDMWKTLGCPDIYGKWTNYKRSEKNYHDDYTPYWIDIKGFPRVENFDHRVRSIKAFSYPNKNREYQNKNWQLLSEGKLTKVDQSDNYFDRFMKRIKPTFYAVNNERFTLKVEPTSKFDLIISPTSGYFTEKLVEELNFTGKVIFYDYLQKNLDTKRQIVDMNMSWEEQMKIRDWMADSNVFHYMTTGWKNKETADMYTEAYGKDHNYLRELQEKMSEKCDVEYMFMDLINPDWELLKEKIKGKRVFFNSSNIYSYHITHATNTMEELYTSFYKLLQTLYSSEHFYFVGTRPSKDRIYFDKSIKLFKWEYQSQYTKPRPVQ
tara:strand:- start:723 stop:2141 length:1419 start_codon:yes stop_codon:yes gene_type:complete